MEGLDIAIAGCGIAGLASALLLQRQGHRVTLYERFDSPQPVGSGLMIQPTGMAVLDALGLARQAVAAGAQVQRLHGLNREGEAVLEAGYADLPGDAVFGLGIHRASLFDVLFRAVTAQGVTIATGHAVTASEPDGSGRKLRFANQAGEPRHDLLVDCLGAGSPLSPSAGHELPFGALWCTLDWPRGGPFDACLLEQRYEQASRMAGVLPTGRRIAGGQDEFSFFWSLRQADFENWRKAGLDAWKAEVLALWPECDTILDQIVTAGQMTFARYSHRTFARPVEHALIHIGDAWHSASPQLGQGANMALLDAAALALALDQPGELQARLQSVIALRRGHVRLYQRLTAAFTPLYQSASGWPAAVRDLLLAPASRIAPGPAVKALLVAGLTGSPLARLGLAVPDYPGLTAKNQSPAANPSVTSARASSLDQS